ncbi:hypothetical protein NQ317_012451 [Molorchus minor]|uniref:Uncharacterized protein n=1 Tax=Molorchus minor TaxID=1323400 RepID=A0ABQ9IZS3_9CUCU|nr:hypothetical protein NQ317_012451 [Molorchus minor]
MTPQDLKQIENFKARKSRNHHPLLKMKILLQCVQTLLLDRPRCTYLPTPSRFGKSALRADVPTSSWQLRCQWGSFAAYGVACGHASSRLEKILKRIGGNSFGDLGKVVAVVKFGEFSYRYGNSRNRFLVPKNIRKDTKHDAFGRVRTKSGKFRQSRECSIVSGIVAIDSGLENIDKDTKHGGFMLRKSSGKIGRARIVSGIVVIDSLHPKI